jgi:hypothetical protein
MEVLEMQRLMILLLTVLLVAFLASLAWSDDGIDITEPMKVSALTDLQEKIDSVSAGVGGCMKAGKAHGECMCENKKKSSNSTGPWKNSLRYIRT